MARIILIVSALLLLTVHPVAGRQADRANPPTPETDGSPSHQNQPSDLVSTLAQISSLASLRLAIESSGLAEALRSTGPFTLLAPSDAAFARLDRTALASLMAPENQPALAAIIAHHVIPGRRSAADLATMPGAPSLSGQQLEIRRGQAGPIIAGAAIIQADIQADNGVIHVIDTLLIPTTRDIRALLESSGRFGTFVSLLDRADAWDLLETGADVTLLAPTDEAFTTLTSDYVSLLHSRRNHAQLRSLIENHIIRSRVTAPQAVAQRSIQTSLGSTIRVSHEDGGRVRLQYTEKESAVIIAPDLEATNGLVHAVDSVVMPPAGLGLTPDGRLVLGIFPASAGSVLASQFALDGKRALVVNGLTRNGNAERAGVQPNDVIVAINGKVATAAELSKAKDVAGYGGIVELTIFRKGERMVINVPVGVE